ncbi:PREDICTED: E3 ubiquitin-protein ligase TRAIP-like [Tarenaya hassleriana]|uniref:E3 ubiquitin-protein ligase TRAIP-like n=1 Tax=Tarenaya hassleriana TaxID=28532 RepID=UPI00053C50E6|nr:PREDICTED: E3 ubiquitin-protein ligase TRAIP-like [Tarenaya hassleriana]
MGSPICSICYEDLKPVVEHLQSISACGHVFHELCLQQWFEYCSSSNKRTCPVCKQKCLVKDACRLFFQSAGNQCDSIASQKVADLEGDPTVLRGEVQRLQGKISGLSSAMEGQKKEIVEVSNELRLCKEQLKEEKEKRWEALQEKSTTQHLLKSKSEECDRLASQCAMLQEKTMALAKELAALKLVSDLSLGEDDVLKLALLGNEAKAKDTIDTLVKSLVVRNRSYKELLAKCNQLGRGEARSSEKLEKAMEKIDKLKKRVRELEVSIEEKENGVLRALKVSKTQNEKNVTKPANKTSASSHTLLSDNLAEQPVGKLERSGFTDEQLSTRGREVFFSGRLNTIIGVDDDIPEIVVADFRHSYAGVNHQKIEDDVQEKCSTIDDPVNKNVKFNIKKDPPSSGLQCKGDICFSSGLLGHDGNKRYLGKWCKRTQSQGSTPSLGSIPGNGELITVGPDGRGGRIKVLRSHAHISEPNATSGCAKRLKHATRTSGSQSQGCLQIEHFFGKSDH